MLVSRRRWGGATTDDGIIAEVRAVRDRLAAQDDYDVHKLFAGLRQRQAALGPRLVRAPRKARATPAGRGSKLSSGR